MCLHVYILRSYYIKVNAHVFKAIYSLVIYLMLEVLVKTGN